MESSSSSDFDYNSNGSSAASSVQSALNSKIMAVAIIILVFVVFFLLSVHVYARWFWRRSSLLRRRSNFIGQEVNSAAGHNIGLDKAAIDQLPTFIYKAPQEEEGLAFLECAVCLAEFQENDKGRLLPTCKHSFHTDCIDMWFHSHSTCPLCRTVVMPTQQQEEEQQQEAEELQQEAMEGVTPSRHNDPLCMTSHEGPSTINHGNSMQYPSNVLFWGNHIQVNSQLGMQKPPPSPSSTTRSIPHITIEIPARRLQDNLTSPGCLSLSSLSRCPSPNDQACSSQPAKSPGLRMSIKRMLSRQPSKENIGFGSNQEGEDSPKDTKTLPV